MNMPDRQRGLSFVGFIIGALALMIGSIFGIKIIPAYIQNAQITRIFANIANDIEMQKASPHDIRMSFGKRVSVDNITSIKADDIVISKDKGLLVLSASYAVKMPLVGNISICLDFDATSAQ